MITRVGMNEGVTLRFTLALCREIQAAYEDKGLESAMALVVNKGFQGDVGINKPTCKSIVEKLVAEDVPKGNGLYWFQL